MKVHIRKGMLNPSSKCNLFKEQAVGTIEGNLLLASVILLKIATSWNILLNKGRYAIKSMVEQVIEILTSLKN